MLGKHKLSERISSNYSLIAILIGVILISLPMGPYQNDDTQVEFTAAQGVLTWGYPFLEVKGNLFDLPPLGAYAAALFFIIFGSTIENGVILVTLFGLASTVVVYKIGKEIYGKSVGLFAAAIFALAPWQLILSRTFLVDAQCLFLSIVCLYFGILAIRKDSIMLTLVSGFFFAAALLTKQYAIFMLIPLTLLYIYHKPKNLKQMLLQLGAFILPALHATLIWYNLIMGKWLLYFVQHSDFGVYNFPGIIPSYSFITTFLVDYGIGFFFVIAFIFSLLVSLLFWKRFPKYSVIFDLVCLATVLFILGLNMYLGVNLNLKAPYTSTIKYAYQALPFFSLTAASLAGKSTSLLKSTRKAGKKKRILLFAIGITGLFLLGASIIANVSTARQTTIKPHVIFRVLPDQDIGYNFVVLSPTSYGDIAAALIQFHGVIAILSGLLWASRRFLQDFLKPISDYFQLRNSRSQGYEKI